MSVHIEVGTGWYMVCYTSTLSKARFVYSTRILTHSIAVVGVLK